MLRDKISHTQSLVGKTVNLIHDYARELRPMALDDLGLLPALNSYLKDYSTKNKIAVQLDTYSRIADLNDFHKTILVRVAQEALSNIAKHAKASQVTIKILKVKNIVKMDITDNGVSFNYKKIHSKRNYKRIGLIGMAERVLMADGRLFVTTTEGSGTIIHAQISLLSKRLKRYSGETK